MQSLLIACLTSACTTADPVPADSGTSPCDSSSERATLQLALIRLTLLGLSEPLQVGIPQPASVRGLEEPNSILMPAMSFQCHPSGGTTASVVCLGQCLRHGCPRVAGAVSLRQPCYRQERDAGMALPHELHLPFSAATRRGALC